MPENHLKNRERLCQSLPFLAHPAALLLPSLRTWSFLNCNYCGAALQVQRGEGYVALKAAKEVSRSIEQMADRTESTIREGTSVTQVELRRLQVSQEISSLQFHLSSLQSEIRSLDRQKSSRRIRRQLKELRIQERRLIEQIRGLQGSLSPATAAEKPQSYPMQQSKWEVSVGAPKNWLVTFSLALFLGIFGVHRFYTGHTKIGIFQLVTLGGFGISWFFDLFMLITGNYRDASGQLLIGADTNTSRGCAFSAVTYFILVVLIELLAPKKGSSLAEMGIWLAIIVAAVVFIIRTSIDQPIWNPIKKLFGWQPAETNLLSGKSDMVHSDRK